MLFDLNLWWEIEASAVVTVAKPIRRSSDVTSRWSAKLEDEPWPWGVFSCWEFVFKWSVYLYVLKKDTRELDGVITTSQPASLKPTRSVGCSCAVCSKSQFVFKVSRFQSQQKKLPKVFCGGLSLLPLQQQQQHTHPPTHTRTLARCHPGQLKNAILTFYWKPKCSWMTSAVPAQLRGIFAQHSFLDARVSRKLTHPSADAGWMGKPKQASGVSVCWMLGSGPCD